MRSPVTSTRRVRRVRIDLIQQGAKFVMDASDILDDLQILLPETKPSPEAAARPLPPLTDDERRVYDAIKATETSIDDIATRAACRARPSLLRCFAWN